jgi:hypothetical protein
VAHHRARHPLSVNFRVIPWPTTARAIRFP